MYVTEECRRLCPGLVEGDINTNPSSKGLPKCVGGPTVTPSAGAPAASVDTSYMIGGAAETNYHFRLDAHGHLSDAAPPVAGAKPPIVCQRPQLLRLGPRH